MQTARLFLFFVFLRFVVRLDVVRVPEERPEIGLTLGTGQSRCAQFVLARGELAITVKPAFAAA